MDAVREYLLSVTASAIICGIVTRLTASKGTISSIVKLLAGVFLAVVVIKPVINLQVAEFQRYTDGISQRADAVVSMGQEMAAQEMEAIIISRTQAYILDKADELGAALEVEVQLNGGIPARVFLAGAVSPNAKAQLSAWIENDLGIPLEAQEWTG